jgi:hypothetical protein
MIWAGKKPFPSIETRDPSSPDKPFFNEDLYWLFDRQDWSSTTVLRDIPYTSCQFIISSSPKRALLNNFVKGGRIQTYFMPTWTLAEMRHLTTTYGTRDDEWIKTFRRIGGIPTYVLEAKWTEESAQAKVAEAAGRLELFSNLNFIAPRFTRTESSSDIGTANP